MIILFLMLTLLSIVAIIISLIYISEYPSSLSDGVKFSFLIISCIFFMIFSISTAVAYDHKEKLKCEQSGGIWEVVGQSTHLILSGKVLIPMTEVDYGCVR